MKGTIELRQQHGRATGHGEMPSLALKYLELREEINQDSICGVAE
jgi:hypothetical protein